jgi:hypothetical protein
MFNPIFASIFLALIALLLELLEVLDLDLETRDFLGFFQPSTSTSTSEF